jgi:hypothetical protein
MYQFSRSIYRELGPLVIEDPDDPTGCAERQRLLDSCEASMRRLAYDSAYFAHPAKTLFSDIRTLFSLNDQLFVRRVIERHVKLALECLERTPAALRLDGEPPSCRAYTRRGTPCRRAPAPNSEYCPSHRHLEQTFPIGRTASPKAAVG